MAGLLNLVPRYLPRFGMAPAWAVRARPLVLVLFVINVVVTLVFRASVEAQSGAYATGVLALILSAALAVTLALWREERRPASVYFGAMTVVFAYTLVDNCVERPDGVTIGSAFILLVRVVSTVSRSVRATEIRVSEADFIDQASAELGPSLVGKQVHIVPMKARSPEARVGKAAEIRRYYRIDEPLAFVHVNLLDNRSEFLAPLGVEVRREGRDYVIEVHGAIAIANTIAYLSEMVDPISIFLSLTRKDLTRQAFRFLFFGEGETGLLVYAILLRYWGSTAEDDVRPRIHFTIGLNGRRRRGLHPDYGRRIGGFEWDRGPAQGRVEARTVAQMAPSGTWASRLSETPSKCSQAVSVPSSLPSVGLFHYTFSDDLKKALRPAIPYGDQRGLEVFYRYAVTPWCQLSGYLPTTGPAVSHEA